MTDPAAPDSPQVDLPAELLQILVCPNCHAALAVDHERSELVCTGVECGLAYPVRDQIPVLLIDAARSPRAEAERARLAAEAVEQPAPTGQPAPTDQPAPTGRAAADPRGTSGDAGPTATGDQS